MPGKYPCFKCDKEVTSKGAAAKAVQCGYCKLWVHQGCLKICDEVYNWIAQQQHFICDNCKHSASETKQQLMGFTTRLEELEERDKQREKEIADINKRLELVSNKVESGGGATIDMAHNSELSVLRELNERESKKSNLVIHSIPESDSRIGSERKEHDLQMLTDILSQIKQNDVEVDKDVSFITRLGEQNPDKPRPLLLKLKTEVMKENILHNAKHLKNSKFEDISIQPDLTKKQRQMEADNRKEMASRNEKMDQEEAKNWEWRMEGKKGMMTLVYRRKRTHTQDPSRMRGGTRGRISTRRGAPLTGSNRARLGSTKRLRDAMGSQEEGDVATVRGEEEEVVEVDIQEPPAKK